MNGVVRLVIITLILAIAAGLVVLIANPEKTTPILITPGSGSTMKRIGIYGAVKTPGLYEYQGDIRIAEVVELAGGLNDNADPQNSNLAKWVDDGETIIIPTQGPFEPTLTLIGPDDYKINLNKADKDDLMKLPGIGEKRAGDIISLREKKGGFKAPEEILEISGISEKLLDSIYDRLIVQ